MQGTPAEIRIAAARRLIARGRFREALDVINEAVRIDPRHPGCYDVRASVFERLGMYPQADADRRKVQALGGVVRPPEPAYEPPPPGAPRGRPVRRRQRPSEATAPAAVPAPAEQPAAPVAGESSAPAPGPDAAPDRSVVPRYPVRPRRPGAGVSPALRALGTTLIAVGLLAAAGVGIYLALSSIGNAFDDDDDSGSTPGVGSETTAPTDGASPTGEPDGALAGDPLSFTRLAAAWQTKGIEATPGEASDLVTGFSVTAVDVTLTRDGGQMLVAVLLYDSPGGPSQDWDLGEQAVPQEGRNIPPGSIVWYNQNAVVVVLQSNDAMHADARTAFFDISA